MHLISFDTTRTFHAEIVLGNSIEELGQLRDRMRSGSGVAFVDTAVFQFHPAVIRDIKKNTGEGVEFRVVEAGEHTKSLPNVLPLMEELVCKLAKTDTLIAIGGGTICDFVAFLAQVCHRGLQLILVPTTLLAQVDAAILGKNGLNVAGRKNKIGSFYYPEFVLCPVPVLRTLSYRDVCSGIAEIIKVFAVGDAQGFEIMQSLPDEEHRQRDFILTVEIIEQAIRAKLALLAEDPFETCGRRALNFGHTFGHFIEELSGFALRHGEAVLLGMLQVAAISFLTGICSRDTFNTLAATIAKVLTSESRAIHLTPEDLGRAVEGGKETNGGELNLVLLGNIGEPHIHADIDVDVCVRAWELVERVKVR